MSTVPTQSLTQIASTLLDQVDQILLQQAIVETFKTTPAGNEEAHRLKMIVLHLREIRSTLDKK